MFFLAPIDKNRLFFIFTYLLGIAVAYTEDALSIRLGAELFLELYLLCAFLAVIPLPVRRYVTGALSVLAYLISLADVISFATIDTGFSLLTLELLLQTNAGEAGEAIREYFSWHVIWSTKWVLLVIGLHCLWLFFGERVNSVCKWSIDHATCVRYCLLVMLVVSVPLSWQNMKGMYKVYAADSFHFQHILPDVTNNCLTIGFYTPIHRLLYAIKAVSVKNESVKLLEHVIGQMPDVGRVTSDSLAIPNICLIIGESYNKHHSELYGYRMPTTPCQKKRMEKKELVVFKDVITSWNYTSNSFEHMMSMHGYGDSGEWYEYPTFPAIFKKAGYYTSFISNQFFKSKGKLGDIFFDNPRISDAMFCSRNLHPHSFDDSLLVDFDSLSVRFADKNLVIVHLIGQHLAYSERYPESWRKILPESYRRKELNEKQLNVLSDYDNATLYNDYVVDCILQKFEDKDAVVIYLADHGDMCFDGSPLFGRTTSITQNNVYQMYEIPFWIWGSKSFREKHSEVWGRIERAKDMRFMTDNIGQLLIGLAGINYNGYHASCDLLSPSYNEKRPRLMRGEIDYDSFMRGYSVQ